MGILIKETGQKRKGKDILLVVLSSLLHGHTVEPQMFVLLKFMIRVYIICTRYRTTTRIVKINSNFLTSKIIFLFFLSDTWIIKKPNRLSDSRDYQTFNLTNDILYISLKKIIQWTIHIKRKWQRVEKMQRIRVKEESFRSILSIISLCRVQLTFKSTRDAISTRN